MSLSRPSFGSVTGGQTARRAFDFGRTHVVIPKGRHQATIVWLHGLGGNGLSWSQIMETLRLPNVKWICPTAPPQPITFFGGISSNGWCDVSSFSEDSIQDIEGLDASAAHVASLLATEPPDIRLGVGGFSMGAAAALYNATCFAQGKFGNGNPYTTSLSAVFALGGWLPCSKTLSIEGDEAGRRAASLPLLLCHGRGDEVVQFQFGEKSWQKISSCGFNDCTFKAYTALGHYTIPEEMDEVCAWLTSRLGLEGK